jgi:hypothetical protein
LIKNVPAPAPNEVADTQAYGYTPTTNRLGTLTHHLKPKRHPSSETGHRNRTPEPDTGKRV